MPSTEKRIEEHLREAAQIMDALIHEDEDLGFPTTVYKQFRQSLISMVKWLDLADHNKRGGHMERKITVEVVGDLHCPKCSDILDIERRNKDNQLWCHTCKKSYDYPKRTIFQNDMWQDTNNLDDLNPEGGN